MGILLVEDERKVANFIARTLRENAYAVDLADTGERALELGKDISYDAILLYCYVSEVFIIETFLHWVGMLFLLRANGPSFAKPSNSAAECPNSLKAKKETACETKCI